jgi:SAM-dependent methyltransferase
MPLDLAIRYAPIVEFARRERPTSILEVGSGAHGIAYYLKDRSIVGTDVKFRELPEKNMRALASSAEALPFRDRSFDMVLSSDMMEHLPEPVRGAVVVEMLRVSRRHLVIGFPSGLIAQRHDFRLRETLRKKGIRLQWLEEHVLHEYPTSESILRVVDKDQVRYRILRNANWRVHWAVAFLLTKHRFDWLVSHLRLDTLRVMYLVRPILHRGTTYREIVFIERT